MQLIISDELTSRWPKLKVGVLTAKVKNSPTSSDLWREILNEVSCIRSKYDTTTIKLRPGIVATRNAYKATGKDPSRYRPSNEQLARRVIQGKKLYSVDTLVDIGNLVSLRCGYSIGVLDSLKIVGDVVLGIGHHEEPYEGIGRGVLNIEGLPVYRDEQGGIATPTSDSMRTKISSETVNICVFFNGYDGDEGNIALAIQFMQSLLERYAEGRDFSSTIVK